MLSFLTQLAVVLTIIAVMYLFNVQTRAPLLGIYRQQSKFFHLKVAVMLFLQRIRPRKKGSPADIDRRQPLSAHPLAIDAVYFNGTTARGDILAIGTAQRKNQRVDGFCVLRVPEFSDRMLVNTRFPDCWLEQTLVESEDATAWTVEGIKVSPVVPMKSWKLAYSGKMKFHDDETQVFDVQVDAIWSSQLPAFNFDVDISPRTIARAIAMEPWSREYFKTLESVHQTHYEQYGDVAGTVTIDGRQFALQTNSVRDHSIAMMRDWRNFHRYIIHFFNLANGDRITVGIVSIPLTFSRLVIGFVTKAGDGINVPISDCDLQLSQHGEQGVTPKDYGFTFIAGDEQYVVQVSVHTEIEFLMGAEGEARVVEMYSKFLVNGVSGWGVAEWQYRNVNGKPTNAKKLHQ